MKNYIYYFLLIILSCKKNNDTPNIAKRITTVTDVVNNTIGTYTCTRICSSGNNINGYIYDTTYHSRLIIEKENDSTLLIEGYILSFSGDLTTKYYHFYQPSSGGGQHVIIDSTFENISFSYWNGGLGGGSGCGYNGYKL